MFFVLFLHKVVVKVQVKFIALAYFVREETNIMKPLQISSQTKASNLLSACIWYVAHNGSS